MKLLWVIVILSSVVTVSSQGFRTNSLIPDCDTEWAASAAGIVQSKVTDPRKFQHVQAVLQSCNKSLMQKLAEVSLFLFEKGTYPNPQLMGELKKLIEHERTNKRERLNEIKDQLPEYLHSTIDQFVAINLNQSLSGNEKVSWTTRLIDNTDAEDKQMLEQMLSSASGASQPNQKPNHQNSNFPSLSPWSSSAEKKEVPAPNMHFGPSPVVPPGTGPSPELTRLNLMPPTVFKGEENGRAIDLFTKNKRPNSASSLVDTLEPISLFGRKSDRPMSVGTVQHENENEDDLELIKTTTMTIPSNIPDPDLLSSRPSLWSETAKLLQESTNIPRKIGNFIQETVKHPEKVVEQIEESLKRGGPPDAPLQGSFDNDMRTFLPARRNTDNAALGTNSAAGAPIVPINQQSGKQEMLGALDRFDSNLGRFENIASEQFRVHGAANQNSGLGGLTGVAPHQFAPGFFGGDNLSGPSGLPQEFGSSPGHLPGFPGAGLSPTQSGFPGLGTPSMPFGFPSLPGQEAPGFPGASPDSSMLAFGQQAGQFGAGPGAGLFGAGPQAFGQSPNAAINQQMEMAKAMRSHYTFPMSEQGNKFLQNLPPWTPMPDIAAQFTKAPNNDQNQFGQRFRAHGIRTYPDFRADLFPQLENTKNKLEREQEEENARRPLFTTSIRHHGEFEKDINDQVDGRGKGIPPENLAKYAEGRTVYIENHPRQQMIMQMPEKQRTGDDLSETDKRGYIPMGRYGKEGYDRLLQRRQPTFETTTVIAVPQRYYDAPQGREGFSENEEVTNPPFQPYEGPERITGSHLLQNWNNIRYRRQNKFVKIDIQPGESIVG